MGFSRQEYWSGLPFPPPGDLPDSGIEPASPVSPEFQVDSLPTEPSGKLYIKLYIIYTFYVLYIHIYFNVELDILLRIFKYLSMKNCSVAFFFFFL